MFRTVPLSIIRSFSLYTQQWYMSYNLWAGSGRNCSPVLILLASCQQTYMTYNITACTVKNSWWWTEELTETCSSFVIKVMLTACEQDQDGTAVPSWSCSQAACHIPLLCVQWKTPDDGQRNSPKHVEFCCKNKFEKLVRLVGFIIRIFHEARTPECRMMQYLQMSTK